MRRWVVGAAVWAVCAVGVAADAAPAPAYPQAVTPPNRVDSGPKLDTSALDAQHLYDEAMIQVAAGQRERAEQLLQLAVSTAPGYVKARYLLGSMLDEDGHSQEAIEQFEQGLKVEPRHARMLTNYGIALMHVWRLDDSDKALQQACTADPHSPYPLNALGMLRERQKRNDDAVAAFTQALAVDPQFVTADVNLGLLALSQKQVPDAEKHFQAAGPGNSPALNGLGVLRWFEGHPEDAEQLFSQALSLDRSNVSAQYNLALYLTSVGRYQEARYYVSGLESDRIMAGPALTLRGAIERQEGHRDLAMADLQRAVSLAPMSVSAQQLLGLVALEGNDLDLAQLHLQTARDLDPLDATTHNDLSLVLQRKGKVSEAIEEQQKAAALAPDVADIQYNLGHLYELTGRGDRALPYLKRYLVLAPQAPDAAAVKLRILQLAKHK